MPANKPPVFLGLDLGGTDLKYGLVSPNGRILISKKSWAQTKEGQKGLVVQLCEAAGELFSIASQRKLRVARIGIGSPGAVNFGTGKVFGNCPNIPGWVGVNLKKSLGPLGVPVYADNDANCLALAELLFGTAKNCRSVLCVTIGTGIGGGLILEGKVYRGSSFSAGEIGHTTVVFNGKKCACGNRGCLEKYASVSALLEAARERLKAEKESGLKRFLEKGKVSVRGIVHAARRKEGWAVELIGEQAVILAAGLASAINLLNPEEVILGGGFIDAYPQFLKLVEKEIQRRAVPAALLKLKIVKAGLGNEAGLVGAAFLGNK